MFKLQTVPVRTGDIGPSIQETVFGGRKSILNTIEPMEKQKSDRADDLKTRRLNTPSTISLDEDGNRTRQKPQI